MGIDIGSTAVKAVVADENGNVKARVRIPHQLRVASPDRLEHDADEAWRRGPLAALDQLAPAAAKAVAVSAMVPSLTAVDSDGRPVTPDCCTATAGPGYPGQEPDRRGQQCRGLVSRLGGSRCGIG